MAAHTTPAARPTTGSNSVAQESSRHHATPHAVVGNGVVHQSNMEAEVEDNNKGLLRQRSGQCKQRTMKKTLSTSHSVQ